MVMTCTLTRYLRFGPSTWLLAVANDAALVLRLQASLSPAAAESASHLLAPAGNLNKKSEHAAQPQHGIIADAA